jgi:hypothetical protein
MTTNLNNEKPGNSLAAADPGCDEMTNNPHPLNAYYTPAVPSVNGYLAELQRLSDQAARMDISILALEFALLHAKVLCRELRLELGVQNA